jgi:hypothetical protein
MIIWRIPSDKNISSQKLRIKKEADEKHRKEAI